MAFIDDIQSRDTALYPIIEIGVQPNKLATPSSIRIAIKPVVLFQEVDIGDFDSQDWFYSPLLLSSPSIKESIDLENRKYKISNVSLKVSNVEYNGERISDSPELRINANVNIIWISPSVEESGRNNGYFAYFGVIRAITHDEKTCNISLEDISQSTLHRDVPIALLTGDEVLEKYKNKPYPMVYGEVDKSPCVIEEISLDSDGLLSSNEVGVVSDKDTTVSIHSGNPLSAYVDSYVTLLEEFTEPFFEFDSSTQYEISGNQVILSAKFEDGTHSDESDDDDDADDSVANNPIANNLIIGYEMLTPSGVTPLRIKSSTNFGYGGDWHYAALPMTLPVEGTPDSPTTEGLFRVVGTVFSDSKMLGSYWDGQSALEDGGDIWWDRIESHEAIREFALLGCTIQIPVSASSSISESLGIVRSHFKNWYEDRTRWTTDIHGYRTRFGGNAYGDYDDYYVTVQPPPTDNDFYLLGEHNSFNGTDDPITTYNPAELLISTRNIQSIGSFQKCVIEFYNLEVDHYMLLSDLLKIDYYVSVTGRT